MDVLLLSRIQFALTIGFHYIYPPLSIGLGLFLVLFEGLYLKTGDEFYRRAARFWTGIFSVTFALGVATGVVMEFEFGTNWAAYSRFVGDVFGSPLAAEGIFAFFLESVFLGVLVFGREKAGPRLHFLSAVLVALGAHLSAFWITVANSWMQTPAGFHVVAGPGGLARAEITDFWAMVFNPSALARLSHVCMGCWQAGSFLVLATGAWYLFKGRHERYARAFVRAGLGLGLAASLGQLATGDVSARIVARYQPAKLAALEGHFEDQAPADMYVLGWVNPGEEKVAWGIKLPGMLSWMLHNSTQAPVAGLKSFPLSQRPPINLVFQSYHAMIAIGVGLIGISALGMFLLWWKPAVLFGNRLLLLLFMASALGPQAANQLGWLTAEAGRQPWIVYNLLKTADALSGTVTGPMVLGSLAMFSALYLALAGLFVALVAKKIKTGPE